jgi:hypothetical protein
MAVTQAVRDHINQWVYGEVDVDYTTMTTRFMGKVDTKGAHECWLWTGATSGGYGMFSIKGAMVYAHRVSYRIHIGPIARGLTIDHDREKGCTSTLCCNPAHLSCVTGGVNSSRKRNMNVFT